MRLQNLLSFNFSFIFITIFCILFNIQNLSAQINLPPERKGDWLNAGYLRFQNLPLTVAKSNNVLDYGAINIGTDPGNLNYQAIMAAIADQSSSGITRIYFPAGTYLIRQGIALNNLSNISFAGDGAAQTRLVFNLGGLDNQNSITFSGCSVIGLENFYITRQDSVGANIDNQNLNFGSNISISNSQKCFVSGVESYRATSTHISVYNSSQIEIRGSYLHHCYTYGDKGHGYGIVLGGALTTKCLIENNIFRKFRHAMILSNAPSDNVFGYNYTTEPYSTETYLGISDWPSDMCLHGHPDSTLTGPAKNLFEGNIGSFMHADNAWGANGLFNTYFRNRATYYGIRIDANSPGQNIIGNELDDKDGKVYQQFGDQFWNAFDIGGPNHWINGNTNNDANPPVTAQPLAGDLALYFPASQLPDFLTDNGYFPPIGAVDAEHPGGGTNPAKTRYSGGGNLTVNSNATQVDIAQHTIKTADILNCYPSPFNNRTKITFHLQQSGNISLLIYNSRGEMVKPLFNGNLADGTHSFDFQADEMNSGIYFVVVQSQRSTICRKVVLLK